MGQWYSFPTLDLDGITETSITYEILNEDWILAYGYAFITIERDSDGLITFIFKRDGNEYKVYYNVEGGSDGTSAIGFPEGWKASLEHGVVWYTDYIYLTQPAETTFSGEIPIKWEMRISLNTLGPVQKYVQYIEIWAEPGQPTISSSLTETLPDVPRIQVSFIPDGNFQDIASVIFDVHYPLSAMRSSRVVADEGDKKLDCAEGKYKQLLSESKSGAQQVHVFAPLVTCYLAGKGNFAPQKIYSVNKTLKLVWPEVFLYAMAKFILNRLLTGMFDMDVLYRRHTKQFLQQLSRSKYSNFVDYFSQNVDKERYFLR